MCVCVCLLSPNISLLTCSHDPNSKNVDSVLFLWARGGFSVHKQLPRVSTPPLRLLNGVAPSETERLREDCASHNPTCVPTLGEYFLTPFR